MPHPAVLPRKQLSYKIIFASKTKMKENKQQRKENEMKNILTHRFALFHTIIP